MIQRIERFRDEGGSSESPVANTTFLPPPILTSNARSSRQSSLGSDQWFSCRVRRRLRKTRARSRPRTPIGEGIRTKTASAPEISRVRVRPFRTSQKGKTSQVSQGDRGNQDRGTIVTFLPAMGVSPARSSGPEQGPTIRVASNSCERASIWRGKPPNPGSPKQARAANPVGERAQGQHSLCQTTVSCIAAPYLDLRRLDSPDTMYRQSTSGKRAVQDTGPLLRDRRSRIASRATDTASP